MSNRNRAWRRRKTRLIHEKVETTKNWLILQFKDPKAKPIASVKQHKHGKLTHVQQLRQSLQLRDDMNFDSMPV